MKKLLLYSFPFCLLVINSCKKNPLPPETPSGTAVFAMSASITENGNTTTFTPSAGLDGYYMNASHYQDVTTKVYVYKAELKQNTCPNNECDYGITILINDFKESALNAAMNPDSGLAIGKYEYNDTNIPPWGYTGCFTGLAISTGSFTWAYSDGTTSTNDTQTEYHFFRTGLTSSVTLTVKNTLGDIKTHTNVFNIGNPLQTNVNVTWIDQKLYGFSATPTTTLPASAYSWEFGDGNTINNAASPTHQYANEAYQTAKLTLTSGTNTCVSYYQVAPSTTNIYKHQANFTSTFTPVPNTKALSAVTVLLTDKNGSVYSSQSLNQAAGSNFEIVSIENYKPNPAGDFTKKLKVRFTCAVNNGGNIIYIANAMADIAVSYK